MTFTLPNDIARDFRRAIRDEMILAAFYHCRRLADRWTPKGTELPSYFQLPPFCSGRYAGYHHDQLVAVDLDTRVVNQAIEAQQAKAIATLEKKVNQALKEGEAIAEIDLHIDEQKMISGTVTGEGFAIDVRSIWNYRYGENSANGILTVYAQTRVNRNSDSVS